MTAPKLIHKLERGIVGAGVAGTAYCGERRDRWERPEAVGATIWCAACDLEHELRTEASHLLLTKAQFDQSRVVR